MRGHVKALKNVEATRIHYNYCRGHSQPGNTPAEQAEVEPDFKENRIESQEPQPSSLLRLEQSIILSYYPEHHTHG